MSAPSFAEAWAGAEAKVLAYFNDSLDTTEKIESIGIEDFPISFPSEKDVLIYTVEIHGPGEMTPTNPGNPFCAWRMDGRVFALFTKRISAQRFAGLVLDALPHEDTDGGIIHLEHTSNPVLVRDVINLDTDESRGGPVRIWNLNIPFGIVFTAAAAETE